jgi:hypothetical protein
MRSCCSPTAIHGFSSWVVLKFMAGLTAIALWAHSRGSHCWLEASGTLNRGGDDGTTKGDYVSARPLRVAPASFAPAASLHAHSRTLRPNVKASEERTPSQSSLYCTWENRNGATVGNASDWLNRTSELGHFPPSFVGCTGPRLGRFQSSDGAVGRCRTSLSYAQGHQTII